ncbi:MAG: hypothetical protein NT099_00335, partial [Candidatus Saganbacteria bacterium]|nr:hypothetical protein [Candidatus Saganbacteria bacterium]
QMRRAVGHDLGIYPNKGVFLAYLVLLFGYHRTKISEVWNLCLNLGDQSRPTFHVDSPIDSLVDKTPGWKMREAFVLGDNRSVRILKRGALAQALASLSAKERKGVFAMAADMAAVSSDFFARQEPWEDVKILLS